MSNRGILCFTFCFGDVCVAPKIIIILGPVVTILCHLLSTGRVRDISQYRCLCCSLLSWWHSLDPGHLVTVITAWPCHQLQVNNFLNCKKLKKTVKDGRKYESWDEDMKILKCKIFLCSGSVHDLVTYLEFSMTEPLVTDLSQAIMLVTCDSVTGDTWPDLDLITNATDFKSKNYFTHNRVLFNFGFLFTAKLTTNRLLSKAN